MSFIAVIATVALAQIPSETSAPDAGQADVERVGSGAGHPALAPEKPSTNLVARTPINATWWQRLSVNGFARIGVFYAFPFREDQLVGGNGGFRLADFRLGVDFHPVEKLLITSSVELAAPIGDLSDPLSGHRIVELRDAIFEYEVAQALVVKAGQFRPPYDAEMLLSDGAIPFVSRSVLAQGVSPPEGYGPRSRLAPDRQLGLQVGSRRLGNDTVGVKYFAGVFNGNGLNQLFNDNNGLNPVARVEVDLLRTVTLGLNAGYNVLTSGVRPTRLSTTNLDYGVDVEAHKWGFQALAVFLGRSSSYSFAGLTPDSSLGVLGQVRYSHERTGLEAAARVGYYEPSRVQPEDALVEVAAMVGYRPFQLPFRLFAQYTHREEERGVSYPNDSVDLMLHATW